MKKLEIKELEDGKIAVLTPYAPRFVELVKRSGAKWNGVNCWLASAEITDVIRGHMREIYNILLKETSLKRLFGTGVFFNDVSVRR